MRSPLGKIMPARSLDRYVGSGYHCDPNIRESQCQRVVDPSLATATMRPSRLSRATTALFCVDSISGL